MEIYFFSIFNFSFILIFSQSSNWHNNATPLLTQWTWSVSVFKSKYNTKFVECPVVDNVPALNDVLYNGHLYSP